VSPCQPDASSRGELGGCGQVTWTRLYPDLLRALAELQLQLVGVGWRVLSFFRYKQIELFYFKNKSNIFAGHNQPLVNETCVDYGKVF
jgi:hypothetical protein